MSSRHLCLVVDHQSRQNSCSCRTWGLLPSASRGLVLTDLAQWARQVHGVGLILEAHEEHVLITGVMATTRVRRGVRRVLIELCCWSDCARVTLELSPSAHTRSDAGQLAAFYAWLGFRRDHEQPTLFDMADYLIRYPVRERTHVRL
jgi:hypothetical protein